MNEETEMKRKQSFSYLLLVLNGNLLVVVLERIAHERSRDGQLVVVVGALEALHVGVLRHRASSVVVEVAVAIGRLGLVLGLDDDVTVLGRHLHLGWVNIGRELQVQVDLLAAVGSVEHLGPHVLSGLATVVHLVRDVDDQSAALVHEARHLVLVHELWQLKSSLERAMRKVLVAALRLVALVSSDDELVALDLGLDRLGVESSAVHSNAILLGHLGLCWSRRCRRTIEPVDHAVELQVELVERIEDVKRSWSHAKGTMTQVNVEHASRKESVW